MARKTLVGSQLRQIRRQFGHTQAEMAERLKISPAYVNLLEHNQRSLSVQVLMALIEAYGVDMRELVNDREATLLADLRAAYSDPALVSERPDLQELRAAIDHAPRLVETFLKLYRAHRNTVDRMLRLGSSDALPDLVPAVPETEIHDFFRDNRNHFDGLERAAEAARDRLGGRNDDMYALLKRHLRMQHGIEAEVVRAAEIHDTLRVFDAREGRVLLSEALDHPNRVFQLAHVLALVEAPDALDTLVETSAIASEPGRARCRVELANYYAAALLLPYRDVLSLAEETRYDLDQIANAFSVSYEQVCHRLTTLQRDGAQGVPFFFLRLDKAGNVTKRFSSTAFALAEKGGACPVWNIHDAFRAPGTILSQTVEMPDGQQFFTFCRTADRPVQDARTRDRRLVVAMGCDLTQAHRIGYADAHDNGRRTQIGQIGVNCHVCPRQACAQRAHQPLHFDLPIDANRRGATRYES